MKVRVIQPFSDKFDLTHTFKEGEVLDFEEKRAADIVGRGLGEYLAEKEEYIKPESQVETPGQPEVHTDETEETQADGTPNEEKPAEEETESKEETAGESEESYEEKEETTGKPKRGRRKKSE